jgi:hypothetical protein
MGIDMNKKCLGLILLAGVAGIFSEIQAGDGPSTPDRIQKKQLTQSPPPNINESLIPPFQVRNATLIDPCDSTAFTTSAGVLKLSDFRGRLFNIHSM